MNRLDEALSRNGGRSLPGICVQRYDTAFVEIAGLLGFKVLWIEMEHAPLAFAEAGDLCRVAAGSGMLSMIRIPDARRESVLKAAECGPDILDLPMANDPAAVEELARHARFAPEGSRGFFGSSRAVRYGLAGDMPSERERINRGLCLMAQIETREAVERAEALCAVPGLDAVFVGLGDLSATLGRPGDVNHAAVRQAAGQAFAAARARGKRVSVACAPADAPHWAAQGVDLIFIGSDISCIKAGAKAALQEAGLT